MTFIILFLSMIFGLIAIYILLLFKYHDLSLPSLNTSLSKNILFIFPHPDDETMAAGGMIHKLAKTKNVFVVSTTHGENGIELFNLPKNKLANMRKNEFNKAMRKLKVKNYEVWNFEDGGNEMQVDEITTKVKSFLIDNNIDTVFTYERMGVYPHPDHIILSSIIHSINEKSPNLKVIYVTLTKKLRKIANLPTKLTFRDREVNLEFTEPELPQFKSFIFMNIYAKYRAAKCYKSQNLRGNMPLWLEFLLMPVEYYTTRY